MTVRDVIEEQAGEPLEHVLKRCADQGITRREIAERYGVSQRTLNHYCWRKGLNRCIDLKRVRRRVRAKNGLVKGVVCTISGETRWRSLGEIADETGIAYSTIRSRWLRGERSAEELMSPPGQGAAPSIYEIGWSEQEWWQALRFAADYRKPVLAAAKLGIPRGALRAAQRGEWHRIA